MKHTESSGVRDSYKSELQRTFDDMCADYENDFGAIIEMLSERLKRYHERALTLEEYRETDRLAGMMMLAQAELERRNVIDMVARLRS